MDVSRDGVTQGGGKEAVFVLSVSEAGRAKVVDGEAEIDEAGV